jgi:hypothetical protein
MLMKYINKLAHTEPLDVLPLKKILLLFAITVMGITSASYAAQAEHPQEVLIARFLDLAEKNPDVTILNNGSFAEWKDLDLRTLELGIMFAFDNRHGFRLTAVAFADALLEVMLSDRHQSYWLQDHGDYCFIGGPAALLGNAYELKKCELARWVLARGLAIHLRAVEAFYDEYFFTSKHFFQLNTPAHRQLIAIFLSRCDDAQVTGYLEQCCTHYKAKFDAIPDGAKIFKAQIRQFVDVERCLIKKHHDAFVATHPDLGL